MFGSDRIQTCFRGLETSSLVGLAPGYFLLHLQLLFCCLLQHRSTVDMEHSVFRMLQVLDVGLPPSRSFSVAARVSEPGGSGECFCGRRLPLPSARRKQRAFCGRCLPLPCTGGSRERWIFLSRRTPFLLDWPVASWSVVKSKAYPAHPLCLVSEGGDPPAASQRNSPLSP